MSISRREFIPCPLYDTDVPREHCGGCEYNIVTASQKNKCGFCTLSPRDIRVAKLSERDDILKQFGGDNIND